MTEVLNTGLLPESSVLYETVAVVITGIFAILGKAVGQYHKLRAAIVAASQARAADAKINEIAGKYLEKEVELNGKVAFLKKRLKTETFTDETRTYSGAGGGGVYTVKGSEKKMGVEVELEKTRMERDQLS